MPESGGLASFLPFIVLIVVFYFLLIRPENKKRKNMQQMREQLSVGDSITTIGGVMGTVCSVKDDYIVIEVGADRVRLQITRWAVSTNNTTGEGTQR